MVGQSASRNKHHEALHQGFNPPADTCTHTEQLLQQNRDTPAVLQLPKLLHAHRGKRVAGAEDAAGQALALSRSRGG